MVLLCLWTTSFSMTIQTKPFASSFTMLGSVFSILQIKFGKLENWKICVFLFWPLVGVKVLRWLTDFVFKLSPPPTPTDAITLFRSNKI